MSEFSLNGRRKRHGRPCSGRRWAAFAVLVACCVVCRAEADEEAPEPPPVPSVYPIDEQDDALAFMDREQVNVQLKAANPTGIDLRLEVAVRPFKATKIDKRKMHELRAQGEYVKQFGASKYYRLIETLPEQTVKRVNTTLRRGMDGIIPVSLGRLPRGFWMLDLTCFRGGAQVWNDKYPIAVIANMAPQEYVAPDIPIVVYTRFMQYKSGRQAKYHKPIFWKTYLHWIAADLRAHGINGIISCGGWAKGELDIYKRYGISGLGRGTGRWDGENVIGTLIGDEPKSKQREKYKAQYDKLRGTTDKAVTTCMVGGHLGTRYRSRSPIGYWDYLGSTTRTFRWYGVKKDFYDHLYPLHYKGHLPFADVLRLMDQSCTEQDSAWWTILPTFGGSGRKSYFQDPSPEQVKGLMHLSVAHGSDALLLFQYQAFEGEEALVDAATLKHLDGKIKAVGEVAPLINRNGALLKSLQHGGLDVRCRNPRLEIVPRTANGKHYVYVVNLDSKNPVSGRLLVWADSWHLGRVRSVYDGKELKIGRDAEGYYSMPLTLGPGNGVLLATDARRKS